MCTYIAKSLFKRIEFEKKQDVLNSVNSMLLFV